MIDADPRRIWALLEPANRPAWDGSVARGFVVPGHLPNEVGALHCYFHRRAVGPMFGTVHQVVDVMLGHRITTVDLSSRDRLLTTLTLDQAEGGVRLGMSLSGPLPSYLRADLGD